VTAAFRSAVVAIVAVLLSFGVTYAICTRADTNPSPAILAAALTVGLMRRSEPLQLRSMLGTFVMLPLIALAAGLIGHSLLVAPLAGAVLFCGGIAVSIWLRQFGRAGSALGRTIALPLIVILVVPVEVAGGGAKAGLLLIAAGAIALASTICVSLGGARLGIAAETTRQTPPRPSRTAREGDLPVATRMALQMLVALALAFAIGMLAFPRHWSWVVLTAFIVCSGAVGRGDAMYKGLLRLSGAIGGTLVAAIVAHVSFPNDIAYATAVFVVLFAGIWLREINYAYWAACATLIFALLQGSSAATAAPLFAARVLGILIGGLCAVAATWFVYPIRTDQVVRRRVADALGALRDVVAGTHDDESRGEKRAALDFHAAELRRVAPPVRLHRAILGTKNPDEHPATWIDLAHDLLEQARAPDFNRAHVGAEMRRLGAMLRARPASRAPKRPPEDS
jgi:hypothetical protein